MRAPEILSQVRVVWTTQMRRLYLGQFLSAIGNGMTLSLMVLYLSQVRGIPVGKATALLALQALLSLVISPPIGTLVDRFGPRPVLLTALIVEAGGIFALGRATTLPAAAACIAVIAVGGAGTWGPFNALVARLIPAEHRPTAFGLSFMLLNLGLGVGGLIGATIIDVARPSTFVVLYTVNAASYVASVVAVLSLGNVGGRPTTADTGDHDGDTGSWREVLADSALRHYAVAALAALTFGYGAIDAGVAVYLTKYVGLPEHAIGVVFAFNTVTIVLGQLFAIRAIRGRSRSRVMATTAATWALAWVLFGAAMGTPAWVGLGLMSLGMTVFALGETLWSPVAPALLNDLAPEHLRGRYNSFQSILWGVSGALGPILTGLFLQRDAAREWTFGLAAGCLVAAVLSLRLRGRLSPTQDGRAATAIT